jgi:hypothetical protein
VLFYKEGEIKMNMWKEEKKKRWRKVEPPFYGELWIDCSNCGYENEIQLEKELACISLFACVKCEDPLFIISPEVSEPEE